MKKIFAAALFTIFSALSFAQFKMPAPSPGQTIKQDFALGTIELVYSRPSIKGRKIFGDLVPYNKIWRTGANSATTLKFTDPVEINGKRIDTGTYALYTIPNEDSWTVVMNKGTSNWGAMGYKESDDLLRFNVKSMRMKSSVETFTMQFANVKASTCELHIMWEKTAVAIPITANITDRMRMQLETAMAGSKKPYFSAAQFYFEYENNNAKALEAINNAVAENPKAYYMWIYKAKIEQATGDTKAAITSSQKSLELAREAKNDDYVKMNEDLMKKLK